MKHLNKIVGTTAALSLVALGIIPTLASNDAFAATTPVVPNLQVSDNIELVTPFKFDKQNHELTAIFQIQVHANTDADNVEVYPQFLGDEVANGDLEILDTSPESLEGDVDENGLITINHIDAGTTVFLRIKQTARYKDTATLESANSFQHSVIVRGDTGGTRPEGWVGPECKANESGSDSDLSSDTDSCDSIVPNVPHFRVNVLPPVAIDKTNEFTVDAVAKATGADIKEASFAFQPQLGTKVISYKLPDGTVHEVKDGTQRVEVQLGTLRADTSVKVEFTTTFADTPTPVKYSLLSTVAGQEGDAAKCVVNYGVDSDTDGCDTYGGITGKSLTYVEDAPGIEGPVGQPIDIHIPVHIGLDHITEKSAEAGSYDNVTGYPSSLNENDGVSCLPDETDGKKIPEGLSVKVDLEKHECVITGTPTKADKGTYAVKVYLGEGTGQKGVSYTVSNEYYITQVGVPDTAPTAEDLPEGQVPAIDPQKAAEAVDAYIADPSDENYAKALEATQDVATQNDRLIAAASAYEKLNAYRARPNNIRYEGAVEATKDFPAIRALLDLAKSNIAGATGGVSDFDKSEAAKAVDAYIARPYVQANFNKAWDATANDPAQRARLEEALVNIEGANHGLADAIKNDSQKVMNAPVLTPAQKNEAVKAVDAYIADPSQANYNKAWDATADNDAQRERLTNAAIAYEKLNAYRARPNNIRYEGAVEATKDFPAIRALLDLAKHNIGEATKDLSKGVDDLTNKPARAESFKEKLLRLRNDKNIQEATKDLHKALGETKVPGSAPTVDDKAAYPLSELTPAEETAAAKAVDAYIARPYKKDLYDAAVKATENDPVQRARLESSKKHIETGTKDLHKSLGDTKVPDVAPSVELPEVALPLETKVPNNPPYAEEKPEMKLPLSKVPEEAPYVEEKPEMKLPLSKVPEEAPYVEEKPEMKLPLSKVPEEAPVAEDKPVGVVTPEGTETKVENKQTESKNKTKETKSELAETGVSVTGLAGLAALSALGGVVAIRRRRNA